MSGKVAAIDGSIPATSLDGLDGLDDLVIQPFAADDLLAALDHASVGVWVWEPATGRVHMSAAMCRIHGSDPDGFDGLLSSRLALAHPDDRPVLDARLRQAAKEGSSFDLEYRVVRPDGSTAWLSERATVEFGLGPADRRVRGICIDVTDRRRATEELHQDPLTGLPNRAFILERLSSAVAGLRPGSPGLAVMFVDLDDFKLINNSLGHETGDRVLQAVGARLKETVRPGDIAARFGGDEFVILSENLPSAEAVGQIAEAVLAGLRRPLAVAGGPVTVVTGSIGVALKSGPGVAADDLIRDADAALNRAKEEGRDRFRIFDTALHERASRKLAIANDLRGAAERGELRLVYQPQFRMSDGLLIGVEALVRWDHPAWGTLGPIEWIPVAEDTGLIVGVGQWVLAEACRAGVPWVRRARARGRTEMKICVNVSAVQLTRPELIDSVVNTLARTGLHPENLCMEITESVLMSSPRTFLEALLGLKLLGLSIAIDDFGTGYSALAYLRRFPFDIIKIDKGFLDGICTGDRRALAVLRAAIQFSEALGAIPVAEGVETPEQADLLARAGCYAVQGYYYGPPQSEEAITRLVDLY